MAGGSAPETKGRTFDFQLNLVPMIDLLSVMISFLLIAAVWIPIARIDVKQQPENGDVAAPTEVDELELRVLIKTTGYSVAAKTAVEEIAGHDRRKLAQVLSALRADHPGRKVSVASEDSVPYDELIGVMDICLAQGLDEISVISVI